MNSASRLLTVLSCLAVLSAGTAWAAPANPAGVHQEPKVVASIRPTHAVKPIDLPTLAKITFEQALKTALAAVPGSIIKAELEVEDGNLMYSFEIVTPKKVIVEVEIDAGDGKVLDIDHD